MSEIFKMLSVYQAADKICCPVMGLSHTTLHLFFFIFCYQKKRLCKKSALAFEVIVSQIPVFCCQTGFSSASMNFYQTKTVCFSAASLLFAKDTLDSMVLNEASFGFICLHVSIVAQYFVELTFL